MGAGERKPASFGALLAHSLLLPLYAATCVLALVFVPHRVGKLLSSALEVAGGPRDARNAPFAAGAMACAFALALAGACGVGRAAASALVHSSGVAHDALLALLALLVPALVGAVLAPFLLAPYALLHGDEGVVESLVRSFELAARRGAARTMRDGALLGAAVGIGSFLVAGLGAAEISLARVSLVLCLALVAGSPLAALALARAYLDARARPAFAGAADARVTRSLRTLALLVVPATLAIALALGAALLTPAPMAPLARGAGEGWGPPLPHDAAPSGAVTIPGAHGVAVVAEAHGVSVEAADGGGAGEIALPLWEPPVSPGRLQVRDAGERWAIVIDGEASDHVTYVDAEGVRLDDGFGDRLAARVGRQTIGLLLLALGLAAWWQRRVRRVLAEAAALDAPELRRDAPRETSTLVRLTGRLRLDEGSVVVTHGEVARVEGGGRFVSSDGDTVMALPPEIPLLLPHEPGGIADGREVSLLVRGDALARLGLREGSTPWPEGARLLATDRDDAAEALVTRAARGSSMLALAIAVSLAWAALSIATRL